MLTLLTELAVASLLSVASSEVIPVQNPVRLIFDTDMGNDIDDALALAMIHSLESRGECELLAVTVTKDNRYSAPFIDLLNTFYGRGGIPVGVVRKGVTPEDGSYTRGVVQAQDGGRPRYPRKLNHGSEAPEAVGLLRKVLARQPDGSVALVQVGFSTNLARLLDSPPDEHSPLSGLDLVRQKVRLLSVMAGSFSAELAAKGFGEYNVKTHLEAARGLFANWPTPLVASGFEIGIALNYPARSIMEDYAYVAHHPIREAYELYQKMPYDRPTWDLTSVLYAVRPDHGYFELSPPGRIVVLDDGKTRFDPTPDGLHRYLKLDPAQSARILEAMQLLSSQPPPSR
jgi:inosine-uridine nucleoside N-ribohydrolase